MKEPEKITPDEFTAAMAWAQVEMEKESEAGNHLAVILASISAAMERKPQIQPLQSMKTKGKPKPKQCKEPPKEQPKFSLQRLKDKVPDGAMTIREMASKIGRISIVGVQKRLYKINAKPAITIAGIHYYSKNDFERISYPLRTKEKSNV